MALDWFDWAVAAASFLARSHVSSLISMLNSSSCFVFSVQHVRASVWRFNTLRNFNIGRCPTPMLRAPKTNWQLMLYRLPDLGVESKGWVKVKLWHPSFTQRNSNLFPNPCRAPITSWSLMAPLHLKWVKIHTCVIEKSDADAPRSLISLWIQGSSRAFSGKQQWFFPLYFYISLVPLFSSESYFCTYFKNALNLIKSYHIWLWIA